MQLKLWNEHKDSKSPLMIFIAGYLSQTAIENEIDGWTEPCVKYAKKKGYALGFVYWESQSFFDLIPKSLSISAIANTGIRSFTEAKKKADSDSIILANYLSRLNRPILLIGHSLGARIAAKAAEHINFKLKSLVLLAAAIEENAFDLDKVANNVVGKPIVCFSKNDKVLTYLYSFAKTIKPKKGKSIEILGLVNSILETSIASPPIGLAGVSNKYQNSYLCYDVSPLTHQQYAGNLYPILESVLKW